MLCVIIPKMKKVLIERMLYFAYLYVHLSGLYGMYILQHTLTVW